jgi:flagellar hook-associated protein FlgK
MSDMFSIGANAIQQYRHSLTTVSNNIANLNTEGYSRQVSNVSESAPVEKGNIFLGPGARLEGVVRSYDQFTEGSLRNSNSEL